ncbi:hypothetical protein [Streptomyces sp. TRM68367]|uniref:hypothetical protein n=1 Tax=Streptomyces sp. TRM68367 TaxID=2758415 RepID=UPI00165C885E|nr:hypothetical protein [Streptomyces sp. TRM68367]MBC9729688.1 hypothetical protein [Streptomyces sp. TRM68367]
MTIARAAVAAPAPYTAGTTAVAVIAPQAGSGYADVLARRGRDAVAVILGFDARPPAYSGVAPDEGYSDVIEYAGDLRRTVKKLRTVGVDAVVAASPVGVELAERIAWQLRLPGSGIPGSTQLRTDRGVQPEALSQAGITAPRALRTASVAEALAWTDCHQASAYQLASAAIGVPGRPVICSTKQQITAVWPQLQESAYRYSGDASLVLREPVEGRHYVVDSVTRLGPDGPQHAVTGIWADLHAPTGLLARTDLLHRHDLLARRLSLYVCSALDALGVASGPMSCHVAFDPERGPVLLSASVVTNRSRADEAVWEISGLDPIDATLDGALSTYRAGSDVPRYRVARICVNVPQRGVPGPGLLQTFAALPTTACVDVDPSSFISRSAPPLPGGDACEIVLAHARSGAIERDYHCIQALMADLHRI